MKGMAFNAEMARALWERRKTVTRRLMKPQPIESVELIHGIWCEQWDVSRGDGYADQDARPLKQPYHPGEVVYVKETWNISPLREMLPWEVGYLWPYNHALRVIFKADCRSEKYPDHPKWGKARWRPATNLEEKCARLHLEIASVRPERIQEITEAEAVREGIEFYLASGGKQHEKMDMASQFSMLWNTLYPGSWERNDWVWRIELEEVWRAR